MRIDRIEASKHKRGRVLVFLADGSLLKVTEQELLTFGLRSGDELDEETLTRLKEAAGVSNIKTTAADLVGRRAMSRRDLETRQRILKDSHCGAFAVICLMLLTLCQWAVFLSVEALPLWPLTLIPAASRACAALAVLTLRPMSTSQYSAMTRGGAPVVFAAIVLAAVCGLSVLLWDSFAPLAAAVCYWLAAWYAFRQLDGMSGDVSGFALTIAELGGAAVLVLWR